MISINNVTVDFGKFQLFKQISFLITKQDKVGLVGKNGAGKSTLLKLITGLDQASSGQISMPKDTVLGYLPQQITYSDTRTVREEAMLAFEIVINLQNDIENITQELAIRNDYDSDDYVKLISLLTDKNERLAMFEPEKMGANAEQVLKGLGFTDDDFIRPTYEFSGGWRMRIELAKILLKRPDAFLLDEPTNHLDIESIQWLEGFLKAYKGAVLVISHDRKFLDNLTKRTVEISMGRVYDYKVSYTKYVQLREERLTQQLAAYENQQKMIQETERFIERFRYKATKAVQVQSRIKQLDKVERIEIDEIDKSHINIKFPSAPRSGTIVVEGIRASKAYKEHVVLNDIDFTIERGDKVAFIG
ncbi:MAG: ABC-F family ATP-binding cassette domain-containing protein, partial [Bacteroidales bacterium]|nr:ABC-F family ATP-binding cassette domain-containing protein [Bacteroidales bacterium]